jgi:rubredoxin
MSSSSSDAVVAERWVCTCCGYVYDPEVGDPEHGIPAGTPFHQLPEGWVCPLCFALKKSFDRL